MHRISQFGRSVQCFGARPAVRSLQLDAYIMDALQAAHNDAIAATKLGDGWKEGRGSRDARTLQRLHLVFRKKIFLDPEEEENHWAVRELIACQALATFNEAWIMPTAEQCLEVMAWHLRLRYGDDLPADLGYGSEKEASNVDVHVLTESAIQSTPRCGLHNRAAIKSVMPAHTPPLGTLEECTARVMKVRRAHMATLLLRRFVLTGLAGFGLLPIANASISTRRRPPSRRGTMLCGS